MGPGYANLDWIKKLLVEEQAVRGDLQAPLVPRVTPDESEPARAATERGTAMAALRLLKLKLERIAGTISKRARGLSGNSCTTSSGRNGSSSGF